MGEETGGIRRPWFSNAWLAVVIGLSLLRSVTASAAFGQDFDSRSQDTLQLIVMLGRGTGPEPIGAGIVIGRAGDRLFVATANHVVRPGSAPVQQLKVMFRAKPGNWLDATLLDNLDLENDLAVLSVSGLAARSIDVCRVPFDRLGDITKAKRGAPVYAVGNPNGVPWAMPVAPDLFAEALATGVVFQSSFITSGHSGGGLLDRNANIVGMIRKDEPPFGLAVGIDAVLAAVRRWGYPTQLRAPLPVDRHPLHLAAEKGDTRAMTSLLADCGDVNVKSTHNETPLHFAASSGGAAAAAFLLKAGAQLDAEDGDGDTPLHWAVEKEQPETLQRLLAAGTKVDAPNRAGTTPLQRAIQSKRLDLVQPLIAAGANINPKGWQAAFTTSPLHEAMHQKQFEMVRILLAAGARVDANSFSLAVNYGDVALIQMLLKFKPDVNAAGDYDLHTTVFDRGTDTPLIIATMMNRMDLVKLIVEAGADVNRNGFNDWTPLAIAMNRKHRDIEQFLIARSAGIKGVFKTTAEELLWDAVQEQRLEAVRLLVAQGVDVNNTMGRALIHTLLWRAIEGGSSDIVGILVRAGANPNVWVLGQTPLSLAIERGNAVIVATLLQARAKPEVGGDHRWGRPLVAAVKKGSLGMIKSLLEAGAEVTAADVTLAESLGNKAAADVLRPRLKR